MTESTIFTTHELDSNQNPSALFNSISAAIMESLIGGENPTTVTTNNVQVSVQKSLLSDYQSSTFSPPQTIASSAYEVASSSMILSSRGLQECSSSDGYLKLEKIAEGTKVSWGFSSKYSFTESVFMVFMNMEKMLKPSGKWWSVSVKKPRCIFTRSQAAHTNCAYTLPTQWV
jgi:hypothetical protein